MIRFLPALLVMATIFMLSHTPADDLPGGLAGLDKLCHGLAYATLAAAVLFSRHPVAKGKELATALFTIAFCTLYGLSDEFHQQFVVGRQPSLGDIIADVSGATLLVLLWLQARRSAFFLKQS